MQTTCSRGRIYVAVTMLGLAGIAAGCGESANPVRPSPVSAAQTSASVATTEPLETLAEGPSSALLDMDATGSAARLSPAELQTRGWTCFQPPVPNRITCSRPHQGRPAVGNPPPADRPATFTFLIFDASGAFVGPSLLIRTDLYNGQLCESTRQPYVFLGLIGYYECVRTVGEANQG